jgi:hypothetical protein
VADNIPEPPKLTQGDPQGVIAWALRLWHWLRKYGKGQKGDKGDQGPPGEGGTLILPCHDITITGSVTLPVDWFPGIVNIFADNLAADTTVTMPAIAEGMWGYLSVNHYVHGAGSSAKFYVKDPAATQIIGLMTGLPWPAGRNHYVYDVHVSATEATHYWLVALERNWIGDYPASL